MDTESVRWIARLTPLADESSDALLQLPLGLDVWQHHRNELIVAATADQLDDIERRRLARVERIETVTDFLLRQAQRNE